MQSLTSHRDLNPSKIDRSSHSSSTTGYARYGSGMLRPESSSNLSLDSKSSTPDAFRWSHSRKKHVNDHCRDNDSGFSGGAESSDSRKRSPSFLSDSKGEEDAPSEKRTKSQHSPPSGSRIRARSDGITQLARTRAEMEDRIREHLMRGGEDGKESEKDLKKTDLLSSTLDPEKQRVVSSTDQFLQLKRLEEELNTKNRAEMYVISTCEFFHAVVQYINFVFGKVLSESIIQSSSLLFLFFDLRLFSEERINQLHAKALKAQLKGNHSKYESIQSEIHSLKEKSRENVVVRVQNPDEGKNETLMNLSDAQEASIYDLRRQEVFGQPLVL